MQISKSHKSGYILTTFGQGSLGANKTSSKNIVILRDSPIILNLFFFGDFLRIDCTMVNQPFGIICFYFFPGTGEAHW